MTFKEQLQARIDAAESERRAHDAAGRGVDALATNIRIQALKEAMALYDGNGLAPNMMVQSQGRRRVTR